MLNQRNQGIYPEDLPEPGIGLENELDPALNDELAFVGSRQKSDQSFDEKFKRIGEIQKENESLAETAERTAFRLGARAYETVKGFPGSLKKEVNRTTDFLSQFRPNGLHDLKEMEKELFGEPDIGSWERAITNPPTTEEVRQFETPEILEAYGKERDYAEPRGEVEKIGDEVAQDIISFFMPGTGQMRLSTRIGAPIAANLTEQGLKYLGVDEKNAKQAKLGTMLAFTLANQANPGEFARENIQQAKQMIPDNAMVSNISLFNNLRGLYTRLTRGFQVPSKARTVQGINELIQQTDAQGRMNFQSLLQARDNINEWISEAGGFDIPAETRPALMRNLNELKRNIIDTINENMRTRFPEAADLYQGGYEAAAVTHQSNVISNFIEKHFGKKTASIGAKVLFPGITGGSAIVFPKTAAVGAGLFPIYKTGQVLYRVGNSPTLSRYYSEVLRASSQANVPAMVGNLSKFDEKMFKEEKKDEIKAQKEMKKGKMSLNEFKSAF